MVGNVCNAPVPSMYCDEVPAPETINVPADVIGDPITVNADGILRLTDVTPPPPPPPPGLQTTLDPLNVMTSPATAKVLSIYSKPILLHTGVPTLPSLGDNNAT